MSEQPANLNRDSTSPWFSALAKLGEIGVVIIDECQTIEYASDKAREMLLCEDQMPLENCVTGIQEPMRKALETAERTNAPVLFEAEVRNMEELRRIQCFLHAVDVEHCRGYLVILRDIDAMEAAERDLRLATRMQNLGKLYQAMAHDLRTPTAAVTLHVHNLGNLIKKAPGLTDRERERATGALAAISDGAKMLDRSLVMLLGDLTAGENDIGVFDLGETAAEAVRLIEPLARNNDIEVVSEIASDSAPVHGSRDRMKQAILNVANNAIESMSKGGILTVGFTADESLATITIADTGKGIPTRLQKRIFEKYFTTKETGTGIGLYVTREGIESFGGKIAFQSQKTGTIFRIEIPLG